MTMHWREALEAQFDGLNVCRMLLDNHRHFPARYKYAGNMKLQDSWRVDYNVLSRAHPYAWSREPVAACLQACRSIPDDTVFCPENLNLGVGKAQFWYLEGGLPVHPVHGDHRVNVNAISMMHIVDKIGDDIILVSLYTNDPNIVPGRQHRVIPSQIFNWKVGETLESLKMWLHHAHDDAYGPNGPFKDEYPSIEKREQVRNHFIQVSDLLAKFIIAGGVWMKQEVLQQERGPVERQQRKRFERETSRPLDAVTVVHLRKVQHAEHEPIEGEHAKREYHCRWTVDGHWRNQAFGPKHGDRRLQFIMPYVKGPADKPLRTGVKMVAVDR